MDQKILLTPSDLVGYGIQSSGVLKQNEVSLKSIADSITSLHKRIQFIEDKIATKDQIKSEATMLEAILDIIEETADDIKAANNVDEAQNTSNKEIFEVMLQLCDKVGALEKSMEQGFLEQVEGEQQVKDAIHDIGNRVSALEEEKSMLMDVVDMLKEDSKLQQARSDSDNMHYAESLLKFLRLVEYRRTIDASNDEFDEAIQKILCVVYSNIHQAKNVTRKLAMRSVSRVSDTEISYGMIMDLADQVGSDDSETDETIEILYINPGNNSRSLRTPSPMLPSSPTSVTDTKEEEEEEEEEDDDQRVIYDTEHKFRLLKSPKLKGQDVGNRFSAGKTFEQERSPSEILRKNMDKIPSLELMKDGSLENSIDRAQTEKVESDGKTSFNRCLDAGSANIDDSVSVDIGTGPRMEKL